MAQIFPSLISADLLNLESTIKSLDPYCDGYHLDIMDNHFVPNLTWGPAFMTAIAKATQKKLWVHLMVDDPQKWLTTLPVAPESIVAIHFETNKNIMKKIEAIQEKKWLPSIAINPKTPVQEIFPFLEFVYQVLVMSVEPGHSGQQFIPSTMSKLEQLTEYRKKNNLKFNIGLDGGIKEDMVANLVARGVDQLAIASGIFDTPDPVVTLKRIAQLAHQD